MRQCMLNIDDELCGFLNDDLIAFLVRRGIGAFYLRIYYYIEVL